MLYNLKEIVTVLLSEPVPRLSVYLSVCLLVYIFSTILSVFNLLENISGNCGFFYYCYYYFRSFLSVASTICHISIYLILLTTTFNRDLKFGKLSHISL